MIDVLSERFDRFRFGNRLRTVCDDDELVRVPGYFFDSNCLHALQFPNRLGDRFFAAGAIDSGEASDIGRGFSRNGRRRDQPESSD